MSRIAYGSDLKSLFDTCFMTGTISDINWENDTATVNNISDVPIFYHCEGHTSTVEQGSSAFGIGDDGLIISHTGAANPGASDLKIVAFEDGSLRACCYCPEDSTDFDCDENNPENIDKGDYEDISVVDGCPLYTWEIDPVDSGFWFDSGYSITKIEDTMSETQTVYADTEDETESATIKVTDRCDNTAECEVKTCDCDVEPDVAYDDDTSDDTIDREDIATIAVTGGCPPYAWSVEGTGFWFDAEYTLTEIESNAISIILYADETACGAATITVTDFCEDSCDGGVRCTEGEWSILETCGTEVEDSQFHCRYTVAVGQYQYKSQGCYDYIAPYDGCDDECVEECPAYYYPGPSCNMASFQCINYSRLRGWICPP